MIEYNKWQKMLVFGIVCSFITIVLGEIPLGWIVYPETGNRLLDIIIGSSNLSILQMAAGLLFGAVFIPLQYYGIKAVAEIISKTDQTGYHKIVEFGAKAYAFTGGTVHVLCVAAMYISKIENSSNLTQIPQNVIDFALWLVVPVSVLFLTIYVAMCFAIAVPILKGRTIFPKWTAVFNPLTAKIILNIPAMAINTKFFNAVRMSNMGIGSLMTFVAFFILLKKHQKKISYHSNNIQQIHKED